MPIYWPKEVIFSIRKIWDRNVPVWADVTLKETALGGVRKYFLIDKNCFKHFNDRTSIFRRYCSIFKINLQKNKQYYLFTICCRKTTIISYFVLFIFHIDRQRLFFNQQNIPYSHGFMKKLDLNVWISLDILIYILQKN